MIFQAPEWKDVDAEEIFREALGDKAEGLRRVILMEDYWSRDLEYGVGVRAEMVDGGVVYQRLFSFFDPEGVRERMVEKLADWLAWVLGEPS